MSAASHSLIKRASQSLCLSVSLSDAERRDVAHLLGLLPEALGDASSDTKITIDEEPPVLTIKRFVDGRGLACPMPLLKTKVALRDVAIGESLYVVATDPNSQADITAFCRQSTQTKATDNLKLLISDITELPNDSTSLQRFATIYHFIITKTDSN